MVKVKVDFSEAAEGGDFNPKCVEDGEYVGIIKKAEVGESKAGNAQIIFTIVSPEIKNASYPLYCAMSGKAAWKLRQLLEAVGKKVAGVKAANIDTDTLIGKRIGMELLEDEYDGKLKSKIQNIFPEADITKEEDADGYDDDEPEEDPTPPKKAPAKKAARKPAPEPEPEEEDDEYDEDEVEDLDEPAPAPKRAVKRTAAKKAAPARRRAPAPVEDEEDDDELELDEI